MNNTGVLLYSCALPPLEVRNFESGMMKFRLSCPTQPPRDPRLIRESRRKEQRLRPGLREGAGAPRAHE